MSSLIGWWFVIGAAAWFVAIMLPTRRLRSDPCDCALGERCERGRP